MFEYKEIISRRKARRLLNRIYNKHIAYELWRGLQKTHSLYNYGQIVVLRECELVHDKNQWYLRGFEEDKSDIARNLKLINIRKWER